MGNKTDFFKNPGGEVVKVSANALKTVIFVSVAAVALGLGIGAAQGAFSN